MTQNENQPARNIDDDIDRCMRHEITMSKLMELYNRHDLVSGLVRRLDDIYRILGETVKHDGKLIPTGQASEALIAHCDACNLMIVLPDSTAVIPVKKGYRE